MIFSSLPLCDILHDLWRHAEVDCLVQRTRGVGLGVVPVPYPQLPEGPLHEVVRHVRQARLEQVDATLQVEVGLDLLSRQNCSKGSEQHNSETTHGLQHENIQNLLGIMEKSFFNKRTKTMPRSFS